MVKAAVQAVSEYPSASVGRADGWTNVTTGLGTSRDKTMGGFFAPGCFLDDYQLRDLYNFDDLASKIVDTYPQEEFRLGFGLSGLKPENLELVQRYLKKFEIPVNFTSARIWARLFGGSAVWTIVDDGKDASEPLDLNSIRSVLGIRVLERPWLIAQTFYQDGPQLGKPEIYRVQEPQPGGTASLIGYIHESRLIVFPGERTDTLNRAKKRAWDFSVLQKPYEALRSSGETWRAIELLVTDANQGIYKVKDLFQKVASDTAQGEPSEADPTGGGTILTRFKILDKVKSVFRAIVLDLDEEDYERLQSPAFSGLADLSDRAWRRVASAADIPVPLLQGENPAGLNNTGTMQLQWFWAKVKQKQTQIDEPRLLQFLRIVLSAQDAPKIELDEKDNKGESAGVSSSGQDTDKFDKLCITWPDLWAPTAAELSKMRLETAQAAQIWITCQAMLPEEAILSLPRTEWTGVDRGMREESLEEDLQNMQEQKAAAHEQAVNLPTTNAQDPNDPEAKNKQPVEDPTEDDEGDDVEG